MTSAEPQPSELQQRFQTALNNAIARGRVPTPDTGLGPRTFTAVTAVAHDHPDATAQLIASAYDAFHHEHK
jgi:hypothetical protein